MTKTKKTFIIIVCIILFIVQTSLLISVSRAMYHKFSGMYHSFSCRMQGVKDYADEGNVVYTPQTQLPDEYYVDITSVNDNLYWIYELTEDENQKVLDDLGSENWSLMNENHYNLIEKVDYYDIFGEELKTNVCYICIYVYDEIITDDLSFPLDEQVIIFLYDSERCKYYCYGYWVEDYSCNVTG